MNKPIPRWRLPALVSLALVIVLWIVRQETQESTRSDVTARPAPRVMMANADSTKEKVAEPALLIWQARKLNLGIAPVFRLAPLPQAAAKPTPAPMPEAPTGPPPLPFRFLGHMVENGRIAVLLSHKSGDLVARIGDVLDETYRVDELSPAEIRFTYLPLNQTQTLSIGDKN